MRFSDYGKRAVFAAFDGGEITSDAGVRLWCMDLRISISGSASVFESLSCLSTRISQIDDDF